MFDKFIKLYSKFSIYMIYILIFSNILASFHSDFFIQFFKSVQKFMPVSIIYYFKEKNIDMTDMFHIFIIISCISGIALIWNYFYHKYYINKIHKNDISLSEFEYPSFHMDSIHANSSELTILFLLSTALFAQTKVISFPISLFRDLVKDSPFLFLFCIIGILGAIFQCIFLIMSGFGIIKIKKE